VDRLRTSIILLVAAWAGSAVADCNTPQTFLSQTQISGGTQGFNTTTGLLPGKYACAKSGGSMAKGWNELHNGSGSGGGSLIEFHEGGTTIENVGSWSSSSSGGRGRVTYNYGSGGGSYTYEVAVTNNSVNCSQAGNFQTCANPGVVWYCGIAGAPTLQVLVSTSGNAGPGGTCPNN